MKVAPIYWIWNLDGFDKSQVSKRFEGLLENVVAIISTPGPIADLRNLLRKYESLLPTVEETYKIPMIATYYLYNALVNDEGKVPNYFELLNLYEYLLNRCSIEMMAIRLLTNQEEFPWDIKECVSCYKAYTEKKFAKNAFSIPPLIEICIMVKLANKYLQTGDIGEFENWLNLAIFELPGKPELQKLLTNSKINKTAIDHKIILGLKSEE